MKPPLPGKRATERVCVNNGTTHTGRGRRTDEQRLPNATTVKTQLKKQTEQANEPEVVAASIETVCERGGKWNEPANGAGRRGGKGFLGRSDFLEAVP